MALAVVASACGHAPARDSSPRLASVPEPDLGPLSPPVAGLSWDPGHPERAAWSAYAFTLIRARYLPDLDRAADAARFCPSYAELNPDQRATVWAAVVAGVAFYESSWNPAARAPPAAGAPDAVTGRPVVAEGLLQLGYHDALRGPYCRFDWAADENRAPDDPAKTIFDPFRNLDCGIGILARQVAKRARVSSPAGVYWSVLREGGRFERTEAVAALARRLPFCQN